MNAEFDPSRLPPDARLGKDTTGARLGKDTGARLDKDTTDDAHARGGSEEPETTGRRLFSRRGVLIGSLLGLALGALLSSGALVGLAERQEVGTTRTVALGAANILDRVANFLSLNRPADALSDALDGGDANSEAAQDLLRSVRETEAETPSAPPRVAPPPTTEVATNVEPLSDDTTEVSAPVREPGAPPDQEPATTTAPETPTRPPDSGTAEDTVPDEATEPAVETSTSSPPEPTTTSTTTTSTTTTTTTTTTHAPVPGVCLADATPTRATGTTRSPSVEEPLRIYIGGDSLSRDLGEGLARKAPSDLVHVELDTRAATGLSRPDFFDWPAHLAEVLTGDAPDVIALMFGANDFQNVEYEGDVLDRFDDEWLQLYCRRVDFVMALVSQPGTQIVWVGQPPVRESRLAGGLERMNGVYADRAERHPAVSFVDTWGLFSGDDGGYAETIDGVKVRRDDGVHLTIAGGDHLAEAVWGQIAPVWGLGVDE